MAKKDEKEPIEKVEPPAPACAICKARFGDKVLPVNHDGKQYCPRCFVGTIAPASDGRFSTSLLAVECPQCGTVALIPKGHRCPNCKWRILKVLRGQ